MNWVADYFSLRGLGAGVCGVQLEKDHRSPYDWNGTRDLGIAYRKQLLSAETRIKGCFTSEGKTRFEQKIDSFYETLSKACDATQEAKGVVAMIRNAKGQVIKKTSDEE